MSTSDVKKVVREGPARLPLSVVGNRVWCEIDGELVLARVSVDKAGVFLERVLTRERSQTGR